MILLTTTKEKCLEISDEFPALDFYHFPCIEYKAPQDNYQSLDNAIRANHKYEWVFFLSKKAAETFFERLLAIGGNFFNLSNHLKFAVIGERTRAFLENEVNMPVDFMPSEASSECFAREFTEKYNYDFNCAFNILLPRSELAKDNFKELIEASLNYELKVFPAYNTVQASLNKKDIDELKKDWAKVKSVIFTSKSCVDNFVQLTKKLDLENKPVYSLGAKTSKAFQEHYPDYSNLIEAKEAKLEAILDNAVIC